MKRWEDRYDPEEAKVNFIKSQWLSHRNILQTLFLRNDGANQMTTQYTELVY